MLRRRVHLDVAGRPRTSRARCRRGRIAHHVASYTGAEVTGLNIDQTQLGMAKAYAEAACEAFRRAVHRAGPDAEAFCGAFTAMQDGEYTEILDSATSFYIALGAVATPIAAGWFGVQRATADRIAAPFCALMASKEAARVAARGIVVVQRRGQIT